MATSVGRSPMLLALALASRCTRSMTDFLRRGGPGAGRPGRLDGVFFGPVPCTTSGAALAVWRWGRNKATFLMGRLFGRNILAKVLG